jgi:ABC-type polysaccharide/polyol phosphate transport system ATPase subunit
MIKLENVYKFYKIERYRKVVLNDVSINFEPGVNYAILGINGAGKSTLVRILAGAELPNSGRITRSVRVSWPLGFSGGLHHSMTGRENAQFLARVYGEDVRRVVNFVEDFAEVAARIALNFERGNKDPHIRQRHALSHILQRIAKRQSQVLLLERCPKFFGDRISHFLRDQ